MKPVTPINAPIVVLKYVYADLACRVFRVITVQIAFGTHWAIVAQVSKRFWLCSLGLYTGHSALLWVLR